jgi:hypothetical protein
VVEARKPTGELGDDPVLRDTCEPDRAPARQLKDQRRPTIQPFACAAGHSVAGDVPIEDFVVDGLSAGLTMQPQQLGVELEPARENRTVGLGPRHGVTSCHAWIMRARGVRVLRTFPRGVDPQKAAVARWLDPDGAPRSVPQDQVMDAIEKGVAMKRKVFEYGGIAASVMLIAFGIGSIGIGIAGVNEVRDNLARENIVGTPDSSIPGQKVDTGSEAKAFASVMRHHTLEATGGQTYAEMGRFLDAKGNPTSGESKAAKDPKTGQPVENGLRNMWVTETALTTALNVSFFAERVAFFSIAMGAMLLLTGIGFLVLTLGGALRRSEASEVESTIKHPATAIG